VVICETLNEIFSELIKRKSYVIKLLYNKCILIQEKSWIFIRNNSLHQWGCVSDLLVFKCKGLTTISEVSACAYKWENIYVSHSVKWPQVRWLCTFITRYVLFWRTLLISSLQDSLCLQIRFLLALSAEISRKL